MTSKTTKQTILVGITALLISSSGLAHRGSKSGFKSIQQGAKRQRPLTPISTQQADHFQNLLEDVQSVLSNELEWACTSKKIYHIFDKLEAIQEEIDAILGDGAVQDLRRSPSQLTRELTRSDLSPLYKAKKLIQGAGDPGDYVIDDIDENLPPLTPTELDGPECRAHYHRTLRHGRKSSFGEITKEINRRYAHRPIARHHSAQ